MADGQDLKLVSMWAAAGLAVSAVWMAAVSSAPAPDPGKRAVELAVHNLDRNGCQRMLHSFETADADHRVLWLWAEESAPGVFTDGSRARRLEPTAPPRPYAFRPDGSAVPAQACAFARNSVHVVSLDSGARTEVAVIDSFIE